MAAANQPPSPQGQRIDPEKLTFVWGMEPFPISDTPAHFFVVGGVASGKTITLRLLMQSVLGPIGMGLDQRALIFDANGTMRSLLSGMNLRCLVHSLNPLDHRATAWDIASDINSPSAGVKLAACLLPTDISDEPFLAEAARHVLAAVVLSFITAAPGNWTLRDVLLAVRNRQRLVSVLTRTPETAVVVQSHVKDERLYAGILKTITPRLQPLEVIAARWQHAASKLSLERWLRDESVILFGSNPRFHPSLTAIDHAIFDCLAGLLLNQQSSAARRTWIVLDNFCTAGRLGELPALVQRGRSKGVCIALSAHDITGIRQLYGPQTAEEFVASCRFQTVLRTDDPATAAWAEQHFGPPLRAADLLSLPPTDPAHGFRAFHNTPQAGTHFAHKPWDWVLANLRPPKEDAPSGEAPSTDDPRLQDWTEEDYRRLDLRRPPSSSG